MADEQIEGMFRQSMRPKSAAAAAPSSGSGEQIEGMFRQSMVPARQQGPRSYAWSEVPGAAMENLAPSAKKFYGDLYEAVTSPIETGAAIHDFGANLKNFLLASYFPDAVSKEELAAADRTVNAMVTGFKKNYGGEEAIKRYIAENPVQAFADLSTMFTGGAMAAPKSSAVARGLEKASRMTDPLRPVIGAANITGKGLAAGGTALANIADPKAAALMQMSGQNAPEILNALQNYETFVPGSKPTAAQASAAAGVPDFTAFAQSAKDVLSKEFRDIEVAQANAQRQAIRGVAGTAEDLEAAKAARKAQGNIDYGQASKDMVRADPALGQLVQDPYINQARENAKELSNSQGITFKSNPIQYLHNMKTRMDALIRAETDSVVAGQMLKKQKELVEWMESKSGAYKKARETYAENSKGINQMEVGQYLEDKLIPDLMVNEETAKLKFNEFARAIENAPTTLKKSTGFARYEKLSDVLTPDQVKTVEGIRDDLARAQLAKSLAASKGATALDLKDFVIDITKDLTGPSMVKTAVTLTNDILKRVKGQMNSKLAVELAHEMLMPETAAEALRRAMMRDEKLKKLVAVPKAAGRGIVKTLEKTPPAAINMLGNEENRNALNEPPLITITKGVPVK